MEGAEAGGEGSSAPGRGAARALLVANTIRDERGGEAERERKTERFSGASEVRVRASGGERHTSYGLCCSSLCRSEVLLL